MNHLPWRQAVHQYLVKVISENRLFQEFVHRTQSGISDAARRMANQQHQHPHGQQFNQYQQHQAQRPPLIEPDSFLAVFFKELKDGFTNLYSRKK